MAQPATTGQLRTTLASMNIGDYVVCNYVAGTSGVFGTFSNFGGAAGAEIPVSSSTTPNGTFYFIKVDKGLLISDRVVQTSIPWDTLNAVKAIQGMPQTLDSQLGVIRSLTGGIYFSDVNGNKAGGIDPGHGAWPTNNEWDVYVVNFPTELITVGKTLDDVFHWDGVYTLSQDSYSGASGKRVMHGNSSAINFTNALSNYTDSIVGFRPVFSYGEV